MGLIYPCACYYNNDMVFIKKLYKEIFIEGQHNCIEIQQIRFFITHIEHFAFSCSSADETEEGDLDPDIKAQREKERRQANNARERCAFVLLTTNFCLLPSFLCILAYIH